MKKILLIISIIMTIDTAYSQIIFTDNYSNSSSWTELDDIENQLNFNSGVLTTNSTWTLPNYNQSNARNYKPISTMINSSDKLKVDIDFKISQNSSNQNGLILFALTQNNLQPYLTRQSETNFDCKKNSSIAVSLGDGFISLQLKGTNSFQNSVTTCPNSYSKDIYNVNLSTGINYYFRLVKQTDVYKLQIFNNASKSNSSKVFDTILCTNIVIDSLNYIMHGNSSASGWDRTFELGIDSLSIEKNYIDSTVKCKSKASINQDQNRNFEISAYPSPASDYTTISFYNPNRINNLIIKLHNVLGVEVYNYIVEKPQIGLNEIKINLENFSSQIYFFSISNENEIIDTKRLQITK